MMQPPPVVLDVPHASLAAVAVRPDQFPSDGRLEIAFAGKSNVGKSSLINAMINRKSLARTSQQPGKTRTINFYDISVPAVREQEPTEPASVYFVDLPGYGYAKVSKSESAGWGAMVEGYLRNRQTLVAVLLLLDIRHEPGANDKMLYEWCRYYQLPHALVATKSDKLKRSQIPRQLAMIRRALGCDTPPLAFSSASRDGRDALWTLILDRLRQTVV